MRWAALWSYHHGVLTFTLPGAVALALAIWAAEIVVILYVGSSYCRGSR